MISGGEGGFVPRIEKETNTSLQIRLFTPGRSEPVDFCVPFRGTIKNECE
jgi:hypothetical protein